MDIKAMQNEMKENVKLMKNKFKPLERKYQRSKKNAQAFTKERAEIIEQIIGSQIPNINLKVTISRNGL